MEYKINKTITIPIEKLSPGSEKVVDVICDYCHKLFQKKYRWYIEGITESVITKDCCRECQNKKTQESLMINFGVTNVSCLDDVKAKISEHKRADRHHNWQGGISSLNSHLRCIIDPWRVNYLKEKDYTCEITGDGGAVNLHHRFPFHRITRLVLKELGLKNKSIGKYSQEELKNIEDLFINKHHQLAQPIILREDIHKLYHDMFGYYDNTPKQFEYFLNQFKRGEFNEYT